MDSQETETRIGKYKEARSWSCSSLVFTGYLLCEERMKKSRQERKERNKGRERAFGLLLEDLLRVVVSIHPFPSGFANDEMSIWISHALSFVFVLALTNEMNRTDSWLRQRQVRPRTENKVDQIRAKAVSGTRCDMRGWVEGICKMYRRTSNKEGKSEWPERGEMIFAIENGRNRKRKAKRSDGKGAKEVKNSLQGEGCQKGCLLYSSIRIDLVRNKHTHTSSHHLPSHSRSTPSSSL